VSAATYAYCVVAGERAPSLAKVPRGLPGTGAPRLVACGERRWLVAADAPLDRFSSEALERGLRDLDWVSSCALAHEAVVEHFIGAEAVLPMKLFTLFSDDARALEHLRRDRRAVERALARVRGCVEWGVRVTIDSERAAKNARDAARKAASGAESGAAFLLGKKAIAEAARAVSRDGRKRVDEAHRALAAAADDARQRPPLDGAGRLLLDAAYLVPSGRGRAFRKSVADWEKRLAGDGLALALTGPWPPYHFVGSAP